MHEILLQKIEQKIQETLDTQKIKLLSQILSVANQESFTLGIAVGRIYNAFYYQSKRILKREPTDYEFEEFLKFLKDRKSDLVNLR